MGKTNFDRLLDSELKDPGFAEAYAEANRELDLALAIAHHRLAAGMSQSDLARRVGTSQQQISRIEQANYRGSLRTLYRVAEALGLAVEIRLVSAMARKPARVRRRGSAPGKSRKSVARSR